MISSLLTLITVVAVIELAVAIALGVMTIMALRVVAAMRKEMENHE